jgi:hypothetical protein
VTFPGSHEVAAGGQQGDALQSEGREGEPGSGGTESNGPNGDGPNGDDGHWVRWHRRYEDPDSPLSERLRLVQAEVRGALDDHAPGPIQIVSMCAGQGRDVIDVVAGHRRRADVRARLVEQDPALVQFARDRAAAAGVGKQIDVVQGDASLVGSYADAIPADVVLMCGVFGNISDADIRATILRMPAFCAPGGTVIWTRHRRPPDLIPSILEWFAEAGFAEESFEAPAAHVLSVGCHRFVGGLSSAAATARDNLDPDLRLFNFVGDGSLPA